MKRIKLHRKIATWQAGQALPMALVLLAAAIFIIVPALFSAQISLGVNRDSEKDTRGYYTAEAGIADAVWKFKTGNAPFTPASSPNSYYDIVGAINGLTVRVTLLKYTYTTTNNYIIQSSALSGTTPQANIVALITQSGSTANDVFDQAAVSLQGDITMAGGCTVTTDDIFIVDYCESSWTRSFTTVTCATVTTPRETGVYYDLGKSARMIMTASAAVGNLAYRNTGTKNISAYKYISVWVRSTVALNSGDLKFKIATNTALGGTVESISIPAIPANTGTRVLLTIGTPANFSSLDSIGIYQAVDRGVFTLYVDNVIATNNLANNGNIYANGNISIQPSAIVYGDASATGTISVNTGGGAKIWGTQTPNAPAYPAQDIDIDGYISQAHGAGSQHNPTIPSWGTVSIGPAYFDGSSKDLSIGGSVTVNLTGTVYVAGKLTIGAGATVQGPYTIVADQIVISGGSGVQLAKGVMPFMIATSSKTGNSDPAFHMSGGPQISAIIYAPNGKAYIEGGSGPAGYSVYGSVVAKSLELAGSTSIKYLSGIRMMSQIPGPGTGGTASLARFDYR